MKPLYVSFAILVGSAYSVGSPVTYWIDTSCKTIDKEPAFNIGLKDSIFMAKRGLMRLDASGPYMDEIFEILFRKPKTDVDTFTRVRYVFDNIANLIEIEDQVKSDTRIYCDDDDYGEGKRWIITPDEPDDPVDVKNSKLPRLLPEGADPRTAVLQQWQDQTNWVRMSRGSMGCKTKQKILGLWDDVDNPGTWTLKSPAGEVQYRKFEAEGTPGGINPERVTMTICDTKLLGTELTNPVMPDAISGWQEFSKTFEPRNDLDEEETLLHQTQFASMLLSLTFFHEFTHIDKPYFNTLDHTYAWSAIVGLSAEEAIQNAETYTFYAFLARAADKGYRLKTEGTTSQLKIDVIKEGKLVYDENLERVGGENDVPW